MLIPQGPKCHDMAQCDGSPAGHAPFPRGLWQGFVVVEEDPLRGALQILVLARFQ